jgi:hypothetical protein
MKFFHLRNHLGNFHPSESSHSDFSKFKISPFEIDWGSNFFVFTFGIDSDVGFHPSEIDFDIQRNSLTLQLFSPT